MDTRSLSGPNSPWQALRGPQKPSWWLWTLYQAVLPNRTSGKDGMFVPVPSNPIAAMYKWLLSM